MPRQRQLGLIDRCIAATDDMLKTFAGGRPKGQRPSPADQHCVEDSLNQTEKRHIAGLMRVNHSGEVCAQALYRGQSMTAKSDRVQQAMRQAAAEEEDHLDWCEQRLQDLGASTSYLNPLWYGMSFSMGALAGAIGDRLSLGFVAATEDQVCRHLQAHYHQVPENDRKTRAILEQMIADEGAHADRALHEGGLKFPGIVKQGMTLVSKLMTETSYRL